MRTMLKIACLSALLALSCRQDRTSMPAYAAIAQSSAESPYTENPCVGDPCVGDPCAPLGENPGAASVPQAKTAQFPVADWKTWTKVSKARFYSKSHSKSWVDVYVPSKYANAYLSGETPPDGMKVVKAQYATEAADQAKILTVMVRQQGKSDSNWFWGIYAADGQRAVQQGELGSCVACHEAAGVDLLFRKLK